MKLYAVLDDYRPGDGPFAWLFYDTASGRFFMELPESADEWTLPPLGSFAKRGIFSISSVCAMRWVAQRIIPPDRQNLGMILKENGLKAYDPHRLLVLADGRCAQDDCYITPVAEAELPEVIRKRLRKKVLDVIPLRDHRMIVCFRDNTTRLIILREIFEKEISFSRVQREEDVFFRVRVTPLGNGIEWDEERSIPAEKLYRMGKKLPLTPEDLAQFTVHRTLDTTEMANRLSCSRQYIKQLTDEGRLHPVLTGRNHTLFLVREAEAAGKG